MDCCEYSLFYVKSAIGKHFQLSCCWCRNSDDCENTTLKISAQAIIYTGLKNIVDI